MEELLRLDNVSFFYEGAEERPALTDCSVTIHTGEKIAVLGNNGAGKSTFFLLANGVLSPARGTVVFQGKAVGRSRKERNELHRGVGLVFQDPEVQLLGGTVEEEISFGPMNLRLERGETRRRVEEAIEAMDLEPLRRRGPQYLSQGEKKRVGIADVLAMEPRLLLLDEPAASLDPANAVLLEENLERLHAKGLALAVATHDVDFAWRWAERLLLFREGRLVADGTPEEIFSDGPLLESCHLAQPLLLRAGLALGLSPLPKRIEDLEEACQGGRRGENRR